MLDVAKKTINVGRILVRDTLVIGPLTNSERSWSLAFTRMYDLKLSRRLNIMDSSQAASRHR